MENVQVPGDLLVFFLSFFCVYIQRITTRTLNPAEKTTTTTTKDFFMCVCFPFLQLIAVLLKDGEMFSHLRFRGQCCLGARFQFLEFALSEIEMLGLDLTLLLQRSHDRLILPADFRRQTAKFGESTAWFQSKCAQCTRHDHTLLLVVRRWHAFEGAKTHQGLLATFGLVRHHTAYDAREDLRWRAEMKWTSCRIDVASFAEKFQVFQFVSIERTADVQTFATDDHDVVALEDCLGDGGCQATDQMATAVDDDRLSTETDCLTLEERESDGRREISQV